VAGLTRPPTFFSVPIPRKNTKTRKSRRQIRQMPSLGSNGQNALVMVAPTGGFPNSVRIRLPYVQAVNLANTAGSNVASTWIFRCNSLFDPDLSGGGHQPIGRDVWAGLYNHYNVEKAECSVTYSPLTQSNVPCVVGGLLSDGTMGAANLETFCEQGKNVRSSLIPNSSQPVTLKMLPYDAKSFFGVTDNGDNIYPLGAAMGSNPAEIATWNLYAGAFSAATGTVIEAVVTIIYEAVLTELTDLVQS